MWNYRKETEEANRRKFNEDRVQSQSRIQRSLERTFQSNRSTYMDLKDQQDKINQMVSFKNNHNMKDNQRKFQHVKDNQVRAKSLYNTMSNMNKDNLRQNYHQRVADKKSYANQTQQYSKKLELEEAQLLSKLQQTFQTEGRMKVRLQEVSDSSPVKLKAQKQESSASQAMTAASPNQQESA